MLNKKIKNFTKKKIFIVFGHHDTKNSFNAAVRDRFISKVKEIGHEVDLVNLFNEIVPCPLGR